MPLDFEAMSQSEFDAYCKAEAGRKRSRDFRACDKQLDDLIVALWRDRRFEPPAIFRPPEAAIRKRGRPRLAIFSFL